MFFVLKACYSAKTQHFEILKFNNPENTDFN